MIPVNVDIEYCVQCDLRKKCEQLKEFIEIAAPGATVNCLKGPQGSFEIKINDLLIYSKIKNKTYPEFQDIADNVVNATEQRPFKPVRPTKDECTIM